MLVLVGVSGSPSDRTRRPREHIWHFHATGEPHLDHKYSHLRLVLLPVLHIHNLSCPTNLYQSHIFWSDVQRDLAVPPANASCIASTLATTERRCWWPASRNCKQRTRARMDGRRPRRNRVSQVLRSKTIAHHHVFSHQNNLCRASQRHAHRDPEFCQRQQS